MARTDPQVNIRMPLELKHKLEKAAHDFARSLNAEILLRLEYSFEKIETEGALIESQEHFGEALTALQQSYDMQSTVLQTGLKQAVAGLELCVNLLKQSNAKTKTAELIYTSHTKAKYLLELSEKYQIKDWEEVFPEDEDNKS